MDIQIGVWSSICAVSGRQTVVQKDSIVALYQHRDPPIISISDCSNLFVKLTTGVLSAVGNRVMCYAMKIYQNTIFIFLLDVSALSIAFLGMVLTSSVCR